MRFVIVTGMSGAGRTQAIRRLEDAGFFCVDNLPPVLIPDFARMCMNKDTLRENAAVVVDARVGTMFNDVYDAYNTLKDMEGIQPEILFLDAADDVLIRRFGQTRRGHPLSPDGNIMEGISREREKLHRIKEMAHNVIDTSSCSVHQLVHIIDRLFSSERTSRILIGVTSFGFKRGIPLDADMVFDMRFIPNPFYIPELREKNGLTGEVRSFVFAQPRTQTFVSMVSDLVNFMAPYYIEQDKKQLIIAVGCTGGMHRSVAVAQELYSVFKGQGHRVSVTHRDIGLDLQKEG